MAQPQVVTAQVAFRGGLYETDARPTAITVMKLAGLTALLYVIGAIMELAKTEYREATIQEQFNNTEGLTLTDESLINALYTLTVLAGLCCISSIPLCGYCGAKNNDSTLVNMFCFCSGLCACLSFLGVLSALVAVGPGVGPTCETWEELGLKKTGCYVRLILDAILGLVFFASTFYANQLRKYQRSSRRTIAYQTSPMATTSSAAIVIATPIEISEKV